MTKIRMPNLVLFLGAGTLLAVFSGEVFIMGWLWAQYA